MRCRLRAIYHLVAAAVLIMRTYYVENLCSKCEHVPDSITIRCDKHHEKLFDLDGRALDHLDKSNYYSF